MRLGGGRDGWGGDGASSLFFEVGASSLIIIGMNVFIVLLLFFRFSFLLFSGKD